MAPTVNQHYLPQLLLRGFARHDGASNRKHRKWYITVCKKGGCPYQDKTENIGAKRYFYENDNNGCVEQALNKREDRYAKLIKKIVSTGKVDKNQYAILAELVATLSARTNHARQQFAEIGRVLAGHAMEKAFETHPRTDKLFRQQIVSRVFEEAPQARGVLSDHDVESFLLANYSKFMAARGRPLMEKLRDSMDFEKMTRHAQANSLVTGPTGIPRRYQHLEWSVRKSSEQNLVLGDVGPISLRNSTNQYEPSAFVPKDDVAHVVLPIDASHVILGNSPGKPLVTIDFNQINLASAKLSREFIVARSATSLSSEIIENIGAENRYWDIEIAQITSDPNQR